MASPQSQLDVGFSVGNYQLVRLLGRGGMGDVWLGSDLRADRLVALKFIKPYLLDTPQFRTRFLNEARTLGRLEHDRIVTLYNVVEDSGYLALVLRFIEGLTPGKGTSLADYIDEHGALAADVVLSSARDILPALGFAHERGVIHRDMKPQNILLDARTRSFLTDFGIAVAEFAERGTMTGSMIGTPHYMSPEQITDSRQITVQNKGHRSDIYSYGVVLYEMLTGRVPFCSDSGVEETYKVQHAHCVETPPPLRDINPAVSPALEGIVLRCLAKSPDDRPQTCDELLKDLTAALSGGRVVTPSSHAATVVEKRSGASPAVAPPTVKPAVRAEPVRKGGIPKAAWLGLGGVLIAGGIAYGIFTGNNGAGKQPDKTAVTSDKPVLTGPSGAGAPSGPAGVTGGGTNPAGGGTGQQPIVTDRRTAPPTGIRPPLNPTPAPNSNALAAERFYAQARDFSQKGMPCEGQDAIGQAIRTDPANTKYQAFQSQLKNGCQSLQQAEASYEQANLKFGSGDYCEGKNDIDQALKIAPGNAKYLALQQRLKKGCNLP